MAGKYTYGDISQFFGLKGAEEASKDFRAGNAQRAAAGRQRASLGAEASEGQKDRDLRQQMHRERLAATKDRKGESETAQKQKFFRDEWKQVADQYPAQLDKLNWGEKAALEYAPKGITKFIGSFAPDLKQASRSKQILMENPTRIKTGAAMRDEEERGGEMSYVPRAYSEPGEAQKFLQEAGRPLGVQVDAKGGVKAPYGETVNRNGKVYRWDPSVGKYRAVK